MTDDQPVAGDSGEQTLQSQQEPQPPQALPKYLIDGVEKQSPENLRELACYAEQMADYKEAEAQRELAAQADRSTTEVPEEWDDNEWDDAVDDAREEADSRTRRERSRPRQLMAAITSTCSGARDRKSRVSMSPL